MDRFEEFLKAVIPREMPLDGQVDVRVARSLAWCIAECIGEDGVIRLEAHAERFRPISGQVADDAVSAADHVRDALAFVRDQQRLGEVLRRCMDGQSAEDAVKDTAA